MTIRGGWEQVGNGWVVTLPLWVPTAVLGAWPALAARTALRQRRARRRRFDVGPVQA